MLKILLITPPFTQLNTPYPATPYLKAFLTGQGYDVHQADLGIDLINRIFSHDGFENLFHTVKKSASDCSPNSRRILANEYYYLQTIDKVMNFLRNRDTTLAYLICNDSFLPRASRFDQMPDLDHSFGSLGMSDRARFLATLYIEDIGDLIKDAVTPFFGFSRYAEKLGMSAHSFSPLHEALQKPENIIETWMLELLKKNIDDYQPDIAGITIPFPGNLYSGLKCGQFIKKYSQEMRVVAGGGYVSTELRKLSDTRVFHYLDYLALDDGERPFLNLLKVLGGERAGDALVRTFLPVNGNVAYKNNIDEKDFPHAETGFPDYSDLVLDRYLSLIEIANPMHRLWSDGRWNKLTLAHGCYWRRCSFCDTSLDYINRYESAPASVLVDRIERLIAETGGSGFHFVDEAAPPAVLRDVALEVLKRKVTISWWANIRFEKAFTKDLCRLLSAAGCIAVTGGLETASDRLLKLMQKGVTIRQAAQACANFRDAGIMVHAYLMYGFPTQTEQETIDSLEIVRQFFDQGLIQSAYWHLFTATVHSDVGRNPEKYSCGITDPPPLGFALNDLIHEDRSGCKAEFFSRGLNKAVYNFMHGIGTDFPVVEWFEQRVPPASINKRSVSNALRERI